MDFSSVGKREETTELPTRHNPFDMERVKKGFGQYSQAIKKMAAQAEKYEVTNDKDQKAAVVMAGQVKDLSKKIEAQRKEIVAEPNKFIKSVNGFCKDFTSQLNSIESGLKHKIGQYAHKKELERREAERKAREEAEKLQERLNKEAEEKGVEPVQVTTPVVPKEDQVTRTDTGAAAHVRKQWKGEIADPDEVPREFCSPDMKKINTAIKAGVREIAGVKIFEDIPTVLRT